MILGDLVQKWRTEAEQLKRRGLLEPAAVIESLSDELEARTRALTEHTVNLRDAHRIGGFSVSQLSRLVRSGKLRNAGRKNAPRIYLSDVPRKPGWKGCETGDASVPVFDLETRRNGGREVDRVSGGVRLHGRHLEP